MGKKRRGGRPSTSESNVSTPQTSINVEDSQSLLMEKCDDDQPVKELAEDFVNSTVEMALNKVNGGEGFIQETESLQSPGNVADSCAANTGNLLDLERLNPDAPEFIPGTGQVPNEVVGKLEPQPAATPTIVDSIPKSESRDELVYEVDRLISLAPEAVQAEMVNLDTTNDANLINANPVVPPQQANDVAMSDSEEELNSMVVHEDQPQPAIPLNELIVRDQNIHVIPEETTPVTPSEEQPAVVIDATKKSESVETPGETKKESTLPDPTPVLSPAEEKKNNLPPSIENTNDAKVTQTDAENNEVKPQDLIKDVIPTSPVVSEDLVDLASQVLDVSVVKTIETSNPIAAAACFGRDREAESIKLEHDYLLSGAHEEAIIPRSQPLLYDETDLTSNGGTLLTDETLENIDVIAESPKIIDTIQKKIPETPPVEKPSQQESCTNFALGTVQDIMEKLSNDSKAEEPVAVPMIPDSVPEAECVQDVDSESDDNDAQEWSFVKPVEPSKPVETVNAQPTDSQAPVPEAKVPSVPVTSKPKTPINKTTVPKGSIGKAQSPKTTGSPASATEQVKTSSSKSTTSRVPAQRTANSTIKPSVPSSKVTTKTTATKVAPSSAPLRPATKTTAPKPTTTAVRATAAPKPAPKAVPSTTGKTSVSVKATSATTRTAPSAPSVRTSSVKPSAPPAESVPARRSVSATTVRSAKPAPATTVPLKPSNPKPVSKAPSKPLVKPPSSSAATVGSVAKKPLKSGVASAPSTAASRVAAARAAAVRPPSASASKTSTTKPSTGLSKVGSKSATTKTPSATKSVNNDAKTSVKTKETTKTKQETTGVEVPVDVGQKNSENIENEKPSQNGDSIGSTPLEQTNGHAVIDGNFTGLGEERTESVDLMA